MKEKKTILIIEDEENIRELIKYNLEANSYNVIIAEDGIKGITTVYRKKPDLILLDLMLPLKSGEEICKTLREEHNNTPIIMLTAKSKEENKISGLNSGADDYIVKPFSIKELLARVNALFRRYENNFEDINDKEEYALDKLTINKKKHEVIYNGNIINLTSKEFELLVFLVKNNGTIFSRDELLDEIWGISYLGESRTVDVHIRNIRRKISDDLIKTVRGFGYKIEGNNNEY